MGRILVILVISLVTASYGEARHIGEESPEQPFGSWLLHDDTLYTLKQVMI